jgi:hypothetical protein
LTGSLAPVAHIVGACADQLSVKAGVEFIAARKALIEQLKEQQVADATALGAAADGEQQAQQQQQVEQRQQRTWLQMCVAADRSVMSTLMGLWGALGPWKRLELLCGVAWMLIWKVRQVEAVIVSTQLGEIEGCEPRYDRFK